MADTNSTLTNESGCIANNLSMKAMRVAMENKGLLKNAGALYCGTGRVNTVTIDGETYNIPITIAVDPPTEGVKDGVTYGIQFTVSNSNQVIGAVLVPV